MQNKSESSNKKYFPLFTGVQQINAYGIKGEVSK